jgi:hypothetical protein
MFSPHCLFVYRVMERVIERAMPCGCVPTTTTPQEHKTKNAVVVVVGSNQAPAAAVDAGIAVYKDKACATAATALLLLY